MLQTLGNQNGKASNAIEKKRIDELTERVDTAEENISTNTENINALENEIDSLNDSVDDLSVKVNSNEKPATRIYNPNGGSVSIDEIESNTITASNISTSALEVNGIDFISVNERATQAASDADEAMSAVQENERAIELTNGRIDALENSDTITKANVNATNFTTNSALVDNIKAVYADIVRTKTNLLECSNIKADKTIVLPSPMATPSDWYAIYFPKNKIAYVSGRYVTENDSVIEYSFSVTQTFVEWKSSNYSVIKDISFDKDGNVIIRVKASSDLEYVEIDYDNSNSEEISIERAGDSLSELVYEVSRNNGLIAKGDSLYNDYYYYFPGVFKAENMDLDSTVFSELTVENKIITPKNWDNSGVISEFSSGNLGDVLQIQNCGTSYKKPVWTSLEVYDASNLSLTESADEDYKLVSEKKLANWNGKVSNDKCPIKYADTLTAKSVDVETILKSDVIMPLTPGDAINVCADVNVSNDVQIDGDLYVKGTTHTVQEETVSTLSNTIILRENASTGLPSGEVSGVVINKYNGVDSLGLVADCEGTLRVGTGSGSTQTYPHAWLKNGEWYDNTETLLNPQPAGNLTSYSSKTVEGGYTKYTNAEFTEIDRTELQPLLTRDEAANLTNCELLKWDGVSLESKTATGISSSNGNLNVLCTLSANEVTSDNGVFEEMTINGNSLTCCNSVICGDLYVCGTTNVHGDYTKEICPTVCDSITDAYPLYVDNNTGALSCAMVSSNFHYNPASDILTVGTVNGNLTGTADVASCICIAASSGGMERIITTTTTAAGKAQANVSSICICGGNLYASNTVCACTLNATGAICGSSGKFTNAVCACTLTANGTVYGATANFTNSIIAGGLRSQFVDANCVGCLGKICCFICSDGSRTTFAYCTSYYNPFEKRLVVTLCQGGMTASSGKCGYYCWNAGPSIDAGSGFSVALPAVFLETCFVCCGPRCICWATCNRNGSAAAPVGCFRFTIDF